MAKKKTEDTINLDSILFKCRDILRAARNSGSFFEKRDMMLVVVKKSRHEKYLFLICFFKSRHEEYFCRSCFFKSGHGQ